VDILKAFRSGRSYMIRQFAVIQPITSPLPDLKVLKISTGWHLIWKRKKRNREKGFVKRMELETGEMLAPNPAELAVYVILVFS
jgi:hypothetical protein